MKLHRTLLSLLLSLVLLLSLLPPVSAATVGEWEYTLLEDGTAEITNYTGDTPEMTIPATVDGYTVTRIGVEAFRGCTVLKKVTIPDGVTHLGTSAFEDCRVLKSITIPSSVKSIDTRAFFDCTSLKDVSIPDGMTRICDYVFYNCFSLSSITIPDSVKSIGAYAFAACDTLRSITIPASVTQIDENAFFDCAVLDGIQVDAANPSYSSDASGVLFDKDKTTLLRGKVLGEYTIPDSVKTISDNAFYDNRTLWGVTLGSGVEHIGKNAFYGSALTHATIGAGVKTIGENAFANCWNLLTVFFCGDAPAVGAHAFQTFEPGTDNYSNIRGMMLYYVEGKAGWSAPTWEGYPVSTWIGAVAPSADAFGDVSRDEWYFFGVDFAVRRGLFNGTSDTTFEPNSSMTRAMLVTVLWRLEGEPAPTQSNPFTDVPAGQWYTDAILWAAENEIVNGVGDGKFDPNGNVTREQMAAIMYRHAAMKDYDLTLTTDISFYPDSGSVSDWAMEALSWANATGLVQGSSEAGRTYLLPTGNATRAQVATILLRYVQVVAR